MKHIIIFLSIIVPSLFLSYIEAVAEMQKQEQEAYEKRMKEFDDLQKEIEDLMIKLDSLEIEENKEIKRILENN